jgi:hypothetical protein
MMGTTTDYGSWVNHVDQYAPTVEQTVEAAFGTEGPEGFDIDAIVRDYRAAINQALPAGVSLAGDEFIGPWPCVDVDITACVESVDLWAIVERHATGAGTWKLQGYDTFSSEQYPLEGVYPDEPTAQRAADRRLADLERQQPTATSGGQAPGGIQDRVYIVRPDGSKYRWNRRAG